MSLRISTTLGFRDAAAPFGELAHACAGFAQLLAELAMGNLGALVGLCRSVLLAAAAPNSCTALGMARRQLDGPAYSALALRLSAKMAEHRAQAAEVVAALAGSGLLQPAKLAEQVRAHLADGFVMAGRLAGP